MKNQKQLLLFITHICIIVSCFAIFILHYDTFFVYLKKILSILSPFLYGFLFAYILDSFTTKLETKIKNRYFCIFITELLFLFILSSIVFTIIPQSYHSICSIIDHVQDDNYLLNLASKFPFIQTIFGTQFEKLDNLIEIINENFIVNNKADIISAVTKYVTSLTVTILQLFIGIIVSVLTLANKEKLLIICKKILYATFPKKIVLTILEELDIANKIFHGFFYGKIVDSFIIFIICLIGLFILKMPYIILVSLIVGITNIIPVVGPFIGAIPGIIIIFSESPIKAIIFTIFIIILQQIDGHIIGPKCIASSTGLDTFWVLFAIIFFGELFGILGLLIGVPLFAVIFDILSKLINKKLIEKGFIKSNIKKETDE